jgi:TetR/AcrR family transcriptional repressor of nem operon
MMNIIKDQYMMIVRYASEALPGQGRSMMKVSREQAAMNRERVLDTAARLFRERGFNGVGVADLMREAGLTHGAFYGQFASKEDLMAQACARAYEQLHEHWSKAAARTPGKPLAGIVSSYLSTAHRDAPGSGCATAALGAEASRENAPLRRAFTEGTRAQLDALAQLEPGTTPAERRRRAAVTLSAMVGAMVLARALDDDALSKEILRSVKAAVSQD